MFISIKTNQHNTESFGTKVAERVVNALVTSRLDYCNGLLYGLTEANFNRLQRIQNAAARCVLKRSRDSSATAMLNLLHWLPIRKRIIFKLLLLVYKARNGMAPQYLIDHIMLYKPSRNLRSNTRDLLMVNRTHYSIGDSSFIVSAAVLWNSLPLNLKNVKNIYNFKRSLTSFLFN